MNSKRACKKTYLFITDTNFDIERMTGAHKRFLELVQGISKSNNVILLSYSLPNKYVLNNINHILIKRKKNSFLPDHIAGLIVLIHELKKINKSFTYDYAISFGPTNTIAYSICGFENIISLFREDSIGYIKVLGASNAKIKYYSFIEKIAVKASSKIIVQCQNDKNNLIKRNMKYDRDIEKKLFVQINNANVSWMSISEGKKNYNKQMITFLFIGDFSNNRKGHDLLLPTISKIIDCGFKIELLVVGGGCNLRVYKEKYASYSQIIFLDRVRDISNYLNKSDAVIVPSLIDSCPNTVLESLNAGVTVYGANTGGIPDLLVNEEYMFEPEKEYLYNFLLNKIVSNSIEKDGILQKERKIELTFDWAKKIEMIINHSDHFDT